MHHMFKALIICLVFIQCTFSQTVEPYTGKLASIIKSDSNKTGKSLSSDTSLLISSISPVDEMPKWHSMVTNLPGDCYNWSKEYISKDHIVPIALITVSTAILIATDDITWRESDKIYKRTQFNKSISDFFTEFGDGRTQFALAAGFGLYGLAGSNDRSLRTASQIVEAVLASGFTVQILKHITGRESPFVRTSPTGIWRFFPNQIEYHKHVPHYDAFPSGHICTSVATFVVIQENYPEHKWITPVSCALAGLICFGMANQGIHWYSDYPLGIAIGYTYGKMIAGGSKSNNNDNGSGISLLPFIGKDGMNLRLSYSF